MTFDTDFWVGLQQVTKFMQGAMRDENLRTRRERIATALMAAQMANPDRAMIPMADMANIAVTGADLLAERLEQ